MSPPPPPSAQGAPQLVQFFQSFSKLAALATVLVGAAVLAGWVLGSAWLHAVHPNLLPMTPNAALCFILAGIALWLAQGRRESGPGRCHLVQQTCAVLVAGVGGVTVLEHVLGVELGLDGLLFANSPGWGSTPCAGRMSPLTALVSAGLGVALVLLEQPKGVRIAQLLSLAAGHLCLLGLLDYIYGSFVFLGYTFSFIAMPLPSVVAALALCLGVLFARPDEELTRLLVNEGTGGRTARRLLLAVLCLPVALDLLTVPGEKAGYYNSLTQAALQTFMVISIFGWLAYRIGCSLEQAEVRQRRAEEAVRGSERAYRLLFESSPQPMYVYDVNTLEFLAVNAAAIEHYGYSRQKFLKMTLKDLRLPEDVPALLEMVPKLRCKETTGNIWRHRKRDGTMIWVQVDSHALPFAGRAARLALATDITERKKVEGERELLLTTLKDALANVKTLSGLLPMCASCKKIRNDQGYWDRLESYLLKHTQAQFTHGLCPDCIKQLYPDLNWEGRQRRAESAAPQPAGVGKKV